MSVNDVGRTTIRVVPAYTVVTTTEGGIGVLGLILITLKAFVMAAIV